MNERGAFAWGSSIGGDELFVAEIVRIPGRRSVAEFARVLSVSRGLAASSTGFEVRPHCSEAECRSHEVIEVTCRGIGENSGRHPNSHESGYMFAENSKTKQTRETPHVYLRLEPYEFLISASISFRVAMAD